MNINWILVVELIKALAWPIVVAFALYILRRPLVELVAQVARRARKLTVFEVSVELATLPELQPTWSAGNVDPRRLSSAQIFDSASQTLFQELLKPAKAEYAIVDLRSGSAWLTSRLFIFALILGEVTGLRAFVFLENVAGVRRRFLGIATPADVRRALGRRYPWLEEAFARALIGHYPLKTEPESPGLSRFTNQASPFTTIEALSVSTFVRRFIEELQRKTEPPVHESKSYLEIETQPKTWERTRWLDGERLERDLDGFLEFSWVEESPDSSRSAVSDAVSRRKGSFVALVDIDRRFNALVDRFALVAEISSTKTMVRSNGDQLA